MVQATALLKFSQMRHRKMPKKLFSETMNNCTKCFFSLPHSSCLAQKSQHSRNSAAAAQKKGSDHPTLPFPSLERGQIYSWEKTFLCRLSFPHTHTILLRFFLPSSTSCFPLSFSVCAIKTEPFFKKKKERGIKTLESDVGAKIGVF